MDDGRYSFSVRSKSLAVYAELRRQILEGVLPPLAPLNQEKLAAELGVSTTPLREALRRLQSDGLVVAADHRETSVAGLDANELRALYEIRIELDSLAAGLAAERHTPEDRTSIEAALRALVPSTEALEQLRRNRQFHAAVYRASGNPLLVETLDALWDRSDRYRRAIGAIAATEDVQTEHRKIAALVLDGRKDQAAAAMRAHLQRSRTAFEGHYAESEAILANERASGRHP
jgi:DNA-binding GntR family transcriptional regulator